MLVMSQDSKQVIDTRRLEITGKGDTWRVWADTYTDQVLVAKYSSEERAIRELQEVYQYMSPTRAHKFTCDDQEISVEELMPDLSNAAKKKSIADRILEVQQNA